MFNSKQAFDHDIHLLQKTMDMIDNQEPTARTLSEKKQMEHAYRQKTRSPKSPKSKSPKHAKKQPTINKTEDKFWKPKEVDHKHIFAKLYNDILTKNKGDKVKTMHHIENLKRQGALQ